MVPRPTHLYVRVRRAFWYGGKARPVGDVLQLPFTIAVEVIASNKAERTEAPVVQETKPADPAAKAGSKGV